MTVTKQLTTAIEKQVHDAAYLFGYGTRANQIRNGEDPFYLQMQETNSRILQALEPIVQALPAKARAELEDVQKGHYQIGVDTANRVLQSKEVVTA